MKIEIKPTSSFWFGIVLGTSQLVLAALHFTSNSNFGIDGRLLTIIWLIAGVLTTYRAVKEYKHRWEISTNGGSYRITKNGVDVFVGPPSELLDIKLIHDTYIIYPRRGECIKISLSDADQSILQLYLEKKKTESGPRE